MDNKTCLITGATSGIGKSLAFKLANSSINLIILSRNMRKCERVCDELLKKNEHLKIKYYVTNISSLREIRKSASLIKNDYNKLDILINNAGAKFNKYFLSDDGFELTFATNYLGHFLLTMELLGLLKSSSQGRIINISSSSHSGGNIINNIQKPAVYDSGDAYRNSKLAMIYFTHKLSSILGDTNVTVNAVDPGHAATKIKLNNGILPWLKHYFDFGIRGKLISASKAADAILIPAIEESYSKTTGQYLHNGRLTKSSQISYDNETAEDLFELSLNLCGLKK